MTGPAAAAGAVTMRSFAGSPKASRRREVFMPVLEVSVNDTPSVAKFSVAVPPAAMFDRTSVCAAPSLARVSVI